jgi:hypothetical protein
MRRTGAAARILPVRGFLLHEEDVDGINLESSWGGMLKESNQPEEGHMGDIERSRGPPPVPGRTSVMRTTFRSSILTIKGRDSHGSSRMG